MLFKASVLFSMAAGTIGGTLSRRFGLAVSLAVLDEVYLKIDGRMVFLWRAVDAEGEVLDVLVQAEDSSVRR